MRKQNRGRSDRFGSFASKLKGVTPKRDIRHNGEVALSLLGLACEQMARGEKPLQGRAAK